MVWDSAQVWVIFPLDGSDCSDLLGVHLSESLLPRLVIFQGFFGCGYVSLVSNSLILDGFESELVKEGLLLRSELLDLVNDHGVFNSLRALCGH